MLEGNKESEDTKSSPQPRVALITGISGQDGSYLAELLLDKGYEVHGIIRRASTFNTSRLEHLLPLKHVVPQRFFLHYGDLGDSTNVTAIVGKVRPHEIYNLGAQSHVKVSFEMPEYTADVDGIGALRLLGAIVTCGLEKSCRFYQASTSELFGRVVETPQTERTPFHPRSPYAIAKQFSFWTVVNYREAYNIFAVNGILFNHESPRRGETFVTRKITTAIAKIQMGVEETLWLGNLNAMRDWGHAKDYVEGMWRMLQQDQPDDYVLATGETHSVREFVEQAFLCTGVTIAWRGSGLEEIGVDAANPSRVFVRVSPLHFRPAEVDLLLGDASKARRELGWAPGTTFLQLVAEMMEHDLRDLKRKSTAAVAH